jgi:hypothetical protein
MNIIRNWFSWVMITGLPLSCTFLVHDSLEQCEWCSNRNYPKASGNIHFKENVGHFRSSQWLKGLLNRQGSELLQWRNADPVFSDIWTLASLTPILRSTIRNNRCHCSVLFLPEICNLMMTSCDHLVLGVRDLAWVLCPELYCSI